MKAAWRDVAIGELCEILDNQRKPITKKDRVTGPYPYYGATGVLDCVDGYLFDEPLVLVGEDGAKWESGDSTAFAIKGKAWVNNHAHVLRPKRDLLVDQWLIYFLNHTDLTKYVSGLTVPKLNQASLRSILAPLPPLSEQKRIVAKLDGAFVGLAKAKENAEKNLQNARALFESTLDDVFARNSEDWAVKQLEDVCDIGDGNHSSNYPKKHELVAKGVPFIRATNLVGGEISNEDMRFLSPKKHSQLKKGHLKTGDILFTNRGEIGKMAIVDPSHDGSNLNSQVAWLRCSETLNNRFLFYFLHSSKIKAHLESAKNGAALQQFTIKQIKELKIPIPSKDQQKEIVLGLNGLSKETQRLTRLYEQKLEALDSLKKSILHEAFSGEL